jgi:hypothetical protein
MSVPSVVKGNYFDVAVSLDGGTTFTTVCGLTTRSLTEQYNTSDEFIRDCADPTQVPFRVVNVTGAQFDISGTGLYNRAQGDLIRQLGGQSLVYRFIMGEDASDVVDAGHYQGKFVLTNKQIGASDGSYASSQFTWTSDGIVTWTPGDEIVVLDPLSVTPKTVVHGVAWSGTVTGTTTGSTLAAASSDATSLTVTGTGATRTVSGTFTAAGTPKVTFTETLSGASNSPKASAFNINVT